MKKAVFIRLDKIGDLICTLPVDQVEHLRDWEITWVIAKGLAFVPDHAVPPRKYLELDPKNPSESRQLFQKFIKDFSPDVAISFQAPWWVNFSLWKTRVPLRIGVLSKWHSFLFLNKGLRQKRSQAIKHEADYNLDLVRQLAPGKILEALAPILHLQAQSQPALLQNYQLSPRQYMVVHPGMAGSALNWPTEYYIELVEHLTSHYKVVLTGTPADEIWLKDIKEHFRGNPKVLNLQNQLSTAQLLYILEQASTVFAPSTGVLHMAASLGTRVYGFYSAVKVQAARRWGARGTDTHLFSAPADSPTCMKKITMAQVLRELK
jgi:heptosyltransferase I